MFNLIDAETAAQGTDDFEVALHIPIMPDDKTEEAAGQSLDEEQEQGNSTFCIIPVSHQTANTCNHLITGFHVLLQIDEILKSETK